MKDKSKPGPLDLETPDVTENDRLHAATSIQSPLTPEQYPLKDREMQAAAATADPKSSPPKSQGQ